MINLFRKIRQNLLAKNQMGKYFKYAIGEILLVVIGILIALQINNWKTEHQNRLNEQVYLSEIRKNLELDEEAIASSLEFNEKKVLAIDTIMLLISDAQSIDVYMDNLIDHNVELMSYEAFYPISTSFDNMVASGKIDIILNKELRALLSEYYSYDYDGVCGAVKENTRIYSRLVSPKQFFNEYYQKRRDFKLSMKDDGFLEFHEDREVISAMYIMRGNTIYQYRWFEARLKKIELLLEKIEEVLE